MNPKILQRIAQSIESDAADTTRYQAELVANYTPGTVENWQGILQRVATLDRQWREARERQDRRFNRRRRINRVAK